MSILCKFAWGENGLLLIPELPEAVGCPESSEELPKQSQEEHQDSGIAI